MLLNPRQFTCLLFELTTMRLYLTLGLLVLAPISLKIAEAAPSADAQITTFKAQKRTANNSGNAKRKTVIQKKSKKTAVKSLAAKKTKAKTAHTTKHSVKHSVKLAQHRLSKKQKNQLLKSNALRTVRISRHNQKLIANKEIRPIRMNAEHQKRYIKARQTAIAKLMKQIGKPYVWGGSSPKTGFDCSGLIYYAYKDLVKFKIPRTANAMYHSKNAKPISRTALQRGDLVFFKINQRYMADHVGVYLGNGKFIQSPSTGKSIKITALNEGYWQRHYLGARRMMTPLTIR